MDIWKSALSSLIQLNKFPMEKRKTPKWKKNLFFCISKKLILINIVHMQINKMWVRLAFFCFHFYLLVCQVKVNIKCPLLEIKSETSSVVQRGQWPLTHVLFPNKTKVISQKTNKHILFTQSVLIMCSTTAAERRDALGFIQSIKPSQTSWRC